MTAMTRTRLLSTSSCRAVRLLLLAAAGSSDDASGESKLPLAVPTLLALLLLDAVAPRLLLRPVLAELSAIASSTWGGGNARQQEQRRQRHSAVSKCMPAVCGAEQCACRRCSSTHTHKMRAGPAGTCFKQLLAAASPARGWPTST